MGKKVFVFFIVGILFITLTLPLISNSPPQEAQSIEDLENLTLEELLNVEIIPAVRENLWKYTMLLTLRIYGENSNFPGEKDKIRIATDTERFLRELERRDYCIRKIPLEGVLLEPGQDIDFQSFDLVFVQSKELAKKFAAPGNTLVFSNKKTSTAAFVIKCSGKQLIVYTREKYINAQGAKFSITFLNKIDTKKRKKRKK